VHSCNLDTWEVEAGESKFKDRLGYIVRLSQAKSQNTLKISRKQAGRLKLPGKSVLLA
jgi:hypothetical protein